MTDHDRGSRSRGNRSHDTRTPPHNLDAEEASIGAALISQHAAAELVEIVAVADFYRPAHQHVFGAVRELVADQQTVDVVTVSEVLRRNGTLDDAGGSSYLHELMNATPAVSAVGQYARIVRDTARLRRLLHAAADLSEAAYAETDPVSAVARAQDVLVRLAVGDGREDGSTVDVADIAALLATDLEPEQPTFLTRSDGTSLLYAGKMHVFQAEPSSGKSWIACAAVKEVLDLGGSAVYLDHEDTPAGILRRLRYMATDPDAMRDRLIYARPVGRYGPAERLQIDRLLERINPDLVVIDGVGESLSRNGLSEDKADDVLQWFDLFPRPIAETGAAVLMIDHVSKDPEQRGRWARGSGAKLGAIDGASFQVKMVSSFSRHRAGAVKLVIAKDRPGGIGAIGETAAIVKIEPHGAGERVMVSLEPDGTDLAITDPHKPTHVMARIVREIEGAKVPYTAKTIANVVHVRPQTFREALARLIAEGYVAEGSGRIKTLRLLRPYHGQSNREEPPPAADEPPPELFPVDCTVPEPEWLRDEIRQSLDSLSTDPNL